MADKLIEELANRQAIGINNAVAAAKDTVYSRVSDFWKGYLSDRMNFLSPEEFVDFRSSKTHGTYGVGSHKDDAIKQKQFADSIIELVEDSGVPKHYFDTIKEPIIGKPDLIRFRDNQFSPTFLRNIVTTWPIINHLNKRDLNRPLRVCEIGAGFGATAFILHQMLEIESYTIIDIPENLHLSSVFLPHTLEEESHSIVQNTDNEACGLTHKLNFVIPSFSEKIPEDSFDLIVNIASLGEMELVTSRAYIKWCGQRLNDNGYFYFLNRHNVKGSKGATKINDYGILEEMSVQSIGTMIRAPRPLNDLHYELILSKMSRRTNNPEFAWNAIGHLIAFGFQESLTEINERFTENELSDENLELLAKVWELFEKESLKEKLKIIDDPAFSNYPTIKYPIKAALQILSNLSLLALNEKVATFANCIDKKLEMRLAGLFAEVEKNLEFSGWIETLQIVKQTSVSMHEMTKHLLETGQSRAFADRFERSLSAT